MGTLPLSPRATFQSLPTFPCFPTPNNNQKSFYKKLKYLTGEALLRPNGENWKSTRMQEQYSLFRDHTPTAQPVGSEPENNQDGIVEREVGLTCPNCGGGLEGRKCKLFCLRPGCGYLVTCSEW